MEENNNTKRSTLGVPSSASTCFVPLMCCGLFFVGVFLIKRFFPGIATSHLALLGMLCTAVPLWLHEIIVLKVPAQPSAGLQEMPSSPDVKRILTKLLGLWGTMSVIMALYSIIPFYRNPFFLPFFHVLKAVWPIILAFSIIYFRMIDPRQIEPHDEYWQCGCLFLRQFRHVQWIRMKEHILGWLIKGFFFPIMFGILVKNLNTIFTIWPIAWTFESLFDFALLTIYSVDVIFGAIAYLLTFRIINSHIRSTEPTVLGFLVCLACYYPFSATFGVGLLPYDDGLTWKHWFAFSPIFYYFYGSTILFLSSIYSLSTVALGHRASNLTYRGLVTWGPYRFCKHPAYMSKVISWWLIALPFLSVQHAPWPAVKNTAFLTAITLIYFLRAKTEENHLTNYPEYVQYAKGINQSGLFRLLAKLAPGLAYSEEKARKWKSVVWFKK